MTLRIKRPPKKKRKPSKRQKPKSFLFRDSLQFNGTRVLPSMNALLIMTALWRKHFNFLALMSLSLPWKSKFFFFFLVIISYSLVKLEIYFWKLFFIVKVFVFFIYFMLKSKESIIGCWEKLRIWFYFYILLSVWENTLLMFFMVCVF